MQRLETELSDRALRLTDLKKLAENCPRCFGGHYPNDHSTDPDVVVCIDGNFQHRIHLKASVEPPNLARPTPSLFLLPSRVEGWRPIEVVQPVGDGGDIRQVSYCNFISLLGECHKNGD